MRIGFVGTGAITRALVVGLLGDGATDVAVTLSPRNAAVAAELAARFPAGVAVAESNQAVLDASEVVVIAVTPPVAPAVLSALRFRSDHLVLSLVATLTGAAVAALVAPATRVVRAIPLPSAAEKASPTPVMPPDPLAREIFGRTGRAIETTDARVFDAMAAASGVMAAHFAAAGTVAGWLERHGLAATEADGYVRLMLAGLAGTARASDADFGELSREHTTAGGLNEEFLRHLRDRGVEDAIRSGLDRLLARIEKAGGAPAREG